MYLDVPHLSLLGNLAVVKTKIISLLLLFCTGLLTSSPQAKHETALYCWYSEMLCFWT